MPALAFVPLEPPLELVPPLPEAPELVPPPLAPLDPSVVLELEQAT